MIIIDNNNLQSKNIRYPSKPLSIEDKFISFGWNVKVAMDIIAEWKKLKKTNKPIAIIAKTTKGYPISFMKNNPIWHYRSPDEELK